MSLRFFHTLLPSGIRLHCAEQGPADGRPVLMLHGLSDSWFSFSRILPLLPADWRVIMPDQRGHGESERPVDGYSPSRMAEDALDLLETLCGKPVTVVGHSMGSFVAQHVAAMSPSRVEQVVLIGSAASSRNRLMEYLAEEIASLVDPVDERFVREFQLSTLHRPVPDAFFERAVAESRKLPAHVWRAAVNGLIDEPRALRAIRQPALVMWGEHDQIFSRGEQEELLEQLPQADLEVIPGLGHAPHWEDPVGFAARLVGALEGSLVRG